jgi:hypothetical protein
MVKLSDPLSVWLAITPLNEVEDADGAVELLQAARRIAGRILNVSAPSRRCDALKPFEVVLTWSSSFKG